MPWIKQDECVGCALCVTLCPVQAIEMKGDKAVIDQAGCTKCGRCIPACPRQIIRPNSENPELRGGAFRQGRGGRGFSRH